MKDELIVPLLTSEYEWAQTAWEDYADAYGVTNGDEFFGMLYAADENYSVDGKDQDTIINEIADQYGKDYLALAAAYGDEAYFDEDAATIASEYLVEQKTAVGEGETELVVIIVIERSISIIMHWLNDYPKLIDCSCLETICGNLNFVITNALLWRCFSL